MDSGLRRNDEPIRVSLAFIPAITAMATPDSPVPVTAVAAQTSIACRLTAAVKSGSPFS